MHDQIAQMIKFHAGNAPSTVFGSYLGTQIKKNFPTVDLKLAGGLKRFIRQYCQDEVVWVEKKGGDDVYVHVSKLDELLRLRPNAAPLDAITVENPWRIFTSPASRRVLLVQSSTGDLAGHSGIGEAPGWAHVPKLTVEDHRLIARDFLGSVEVNDRSELEKILQLQEFWQPWLHVIRTGFGGRYSTPWWNFRNQRILETFRERLVALQLPPVVVEAAIQHLSQARHSSSFLKNRVPSLSAIPPRATDQPLPRSPIQPAQTALVSTQRATIDLRQLIHAAIEKLDEEQLREIRLPLGAIADGLNDRKW
jgi:hypothetical protein